jgi:hypothetical protein
VTVSRVGCLLVVVAVVSAAAVFRSSLTAGPARLVSDPCASEAPAQRITGAQDDQFTPDVEVPSVVDAAGASWTQVDDWPVSVTGAGALCWDGGTVVGTYPPDTSWDTYHHTGAFGFTNPRSVVAGLRVHNYGDAVNVREGAEDFRIREVHATEIHDDCIQNDFLHSGVVEDSLFDGCFVGISARPTSSNTTSDGRTETMTIRHVLLRLEPMPTVYSGPAPGHGGFFKWDFDEGRSPRLVVEDSVFRADQPPNNGSLGLPEGYEVSCARNTVVWLGEGEFPDARSWRSQCPDTRIVTSASTWTDAVASWTNDQAGDP